MARRRAVQPEAAPAEPPPSEADDGAVHFGHGPAGAHAPGMSQARIVSIERDILARNDDFAADNRRWLAGRGILALNLVADQVRDVLNPRLRPT